MATVKEVEICFRMTIACDCGCELELYGVDDYEGCSCGRVYKTSIGSTDEEGNGIQVLAYEGSSNIAEQLELMIELGRKG